MLIRSYERRKEKKKINDIWKESISSERCMVNKKLIILRGLPGSGKSDIARKLVGNGVIHSTDSYLIKNGKYEFDHDNIAKYHYYNLMRSIRSMKKGISPIIIDNTNITASSCINYVEQGKMHGYEIVIIEPDTPWAFDIEELVKRNNHNVPRDTIIYMLQKYEKLDVFKRKLGLCMEKRKEISYR